MPFKNMAFKWLNPWLRAVGLLLLDCGLHFAASENDA